MIEQFNRRPALAGLWGVVLFLTVGGALAQQKQSNGGEARSKQKMSLETTAWGKDDAGQAVSLITLKNANGTVVKLTNYGARIVSVEVPDRQGKLANVTLGFTDLAGYLRHAAFFGCTTGRFANRIAGGKFKLDGRQYSVAANNGPNHLHGGVRGFDKRVWQVSPLPQSTNEAGVKFTYRSPDGEEGYPGALDVTVVYTLNDRNELKIDYTAKTDRDTVVNLTNHAYWNLRGAGQGDILGHEITIDADEYIPVDNTSIPTGGAAPVKGTVMDFTEPHKIGERISQTKQFDAVPQGYDHCYVLRNQTGKLARAARVKDPQSGRVMEVWTTEPGVQFYTGNYLDGDAKNGGHQQHAAFCLETQHYPDAPNRPQFPPTTLKPGDTYRHVTVHKFSAE